MCKETSKELSGNKCHGSGSARWARLNVNVELAKHNTVEMSVKLATVQGRNIKVPQLLKAGEDQAEEGTACQLCVTDLGVDKTRTVPDLCPVPGLKTWLCSCKPAKSTIFENDAFQRVKIRKVMTRQWL